MQGTSSQAIVGLPGNLRKKMVLIIVYLFTFIGFTFVALSLATTSWTIKDHFKDFVYPDEYQGLWQKCLDKPSYECSPRTGLTWLYVVKVFILLAFVLCICVIGIFIGSHLTDKLKPSMAATFLLVAALLTLIGMIVYTAKAPLPRTVNKKKNSYIPVEFRIMYGYSYFMGWAGVLLTFIAGVVALLLRKRT